MMADGVIIAPPSNEALEAAVRNLRLCSRRSISGDGSIEKRMGDPLDSSVCVYSCGKLAVGGHRASVLRLLCGVGGRDDIHTARSRHRLTRLRR